MASLSHSQDVGAIPGILASIVGTKWEEVAELERRASAVHAALDTAPPVRDFRAALARPGSVSLIAECKRRSPGAGEIRPDLDPIRLATGYERAGASALSVLTDARYFGGSLEDLVTVRDASALPVLRKDFTVSPLQVVEARVHGADAVLLIVRILADEVLSELHALALDLGMAVLVEVHDAEELRRAVRIGADLVGINNRDLSTFTTELTTTLSLLADVPDNALVVSESGIHDVDDVRRLGEAGVDAILVGEALLRGPDPERRAAELVGVGKRDRVAP